MPKNLGLYNDDLSTPRKKDVDNCYSPNNVPPYPVTSVNSKSGAVTLSKGDVGLGNVENVKQYSSTNPPPYPVTSVSGKTGAVTLRASDVGAVPILTYEWNKQLACGSNGLVCLGKFPCYDTNITIDIDSTTSTTYHGTLVIATQNINTTGGGRLKATVYGDATGTLSSVIKIQYGSGSNVVSVYCNFPGWSRNLVHVRAVALASNASDVLTSVTSIPTEANRTATNALTSKYLPLSGGTITGSSGDTPLKLKSASSVAYVGFANTSGTTLGYVGYNGTNSPVVYTDKAYKIYHEGNKPKASDVGLGNVDNVKQYSANNPPPYPVTSVNGKTGAVTLNDVKYVAQTLTDAQKKQARENIGGVEVVISETQPTNQNIGDIWLKIK